MIKRRAFLNNGLLCTGAMMIPGFLKAWEKPFSPLKGNKVVVVIQLSGGNDGLNTVIPVRNDIYYKSRPGISIAKNTSLSLTDEAGLHPSLTAFKSLFDDGHLTIVNNVGYPNPDRSHFRSMDIWQTASESNEYKITGWLGRYLDAYCKQCDHPSQILELDDTLSLALKGEQQKGIAFKDAAKFYNNSRDKYFTDISSNYKGHHSGSIKDYMYKTLASTVSTSGYIFEKSRVRPSQYSYPPTGLGQSLKSIAGLIGSDINTRVYYVSLGSFDTHAGQRDQQGRLLKQLNDAVSVFIDDLKKQQRFEDVLLFTFSEFGRRVSQNASNGTDHGTANNMFFISGALKQKGLINPLPDLSDLDNGDLKYTADFRDVYATVLNKWLDADDFAILGRKSSYLSFI